MSESVILSEARTKKEKRAFLDFTYGVYAGNPCYKDSLAVVARGFLDGGDAFIRGCEVRPVRASRDGKTLAQCVYVRAPGLDAVQIAFFEALPGCPEAAETIAGGAREMARRTGARRIIAGLNGHVAYGVGFLTDAFDVPASFDSLYCQPWYAGYFRALGWTEKKLTSVRYRVSDAVFPAGRPRGSRITVRAMRMARFREEIMLMGELSNRYLAGTYLYFYRPPLALYELMRPLKPFLAAENLLFACGGDGREVGFVFWHPDYNEVLPGGRKTSMLEIAAGYILNKKRIRSVKLNAIGVENSLMGCTAAVMLLADFRRRVSGRYESAETNFIWDSNRRSRGMSGHFRHEEFRHYSVFETEP